MTEEDALTELGFRLQPDLEPVLLPDEVHTALMNSRRPDSAGTEFNEAGWVGTYDLNWAAAEGWGMKKAKAANSNTYIQDARSAASDYTFLNCERMEKSYRARSTREANRKASMAVETLGSVW